MSIATSQRQLGRILVAILARCSYNLRTFRCIQQMILRSVALQPPDVVACNVEPQLDRFSSKVLGQNPCVLRLPPAPSISP